MSKLLTARDRIKTPQKDLVVLRGSTDEASSVILNGNLVLSVNEPLPVKRVSLRIEGTLRVHWSDSVLTSRGSVSRPVKYEKTVFEHEWPNFLDTTGTSGGRSPGHSKAPSRAISAVSLASLGHHSKSSGNLAALSSSGSSSSNSTKLQGNYEFPFEIILPGDIPETIEGMDGGQVIYKFSATIERGKWANNIHTKKYFRVIRTIGSDSFELSQTVSIENTWPGKIDYAISIPSKAVAIGSHVPVSLVLQPLVKGLKLGQIKVQLAELIQLSTPLGQTSSKDRIAHEFLLPLPDSETQSLDSWEVHDMVPLPTSLTKCTQDAVIGSYIKVAHKLKFAVPLINPDGHTSELRASLPIFLFVSPNVSITSANPINIVIPGTESPEDILFAPSSSSEPSSRLGSTLNLPGSSNSLSGSSSPNANPLSGLMDSNAPPDYQSHVYDRLYNGFPSSTSSPEGSGASTPYVASRRNSIGENSDAQLGMTALPVDERSQLAAGLRALALAQSRDPRINIVVPGSSSVSPGNTPNLTSGPSTPFPPPLNGSSGNNDYFSLNADSMSGAHALLSRQGFSSPDLAHMSRVGTPLASPRAQTPLVEPLDLNSLSRVPSYSTAVAGADESDTELAPGYDTSAPSSPNGNVRVTLQPQAPTPAHTTSSVLHMRSSGPSRTSSSTGLSSFLHRSQSSRSMIDEASRLVRKGGSKK